MPISRLFFHEEDRPLTVGTILEGAVSCQDHQNCLTESVGMKIVPSRLRFSGG